MRRPWTRRLAGVLFAGLLLSSTGCAAGSQMRRGEQMMESGDWAGAVVTFRALCEGDSRHAQDACGQLALAERELQGTAISDARLLMWEHDYEGAFTVLYEAKTLVSDVSDIEDAEREVLADGVQYYDRLLGQGEHREAYEGAVLLSGYYPDDNAAEALLSDTSEAYAEELHGHAEAAADEGLTAAALAYWVTSYDVAPETRVATEIEILRTALQAELNVPYHVEVLGPVGQSAVPTLGQDALATLTTPDQAMLSLRATLSSVRFDETYSSQILQHPYLAGTRMVENPARIQAQAALDNAEQVLAAELAEYNRAQAAYEEAVRQQQANPQDYTLQSQVNSLQWERDSAQSDYEQAQQTRNNANSTLSMTPEQIEEEIWEQYDYEERHYSRTASADLNVNTELDGRTTESRDTLSVRTTDSWHEGNQRYELASDPLHYPQDDRTLENEVVETALTSVRTQLVDAFERHRESFGAGFEQVTTADPTTIDQLTRYVLLRPSSVPIDVQNWFWTHVGLREPSRLATAP